MDRTEHLVDLHNLASGAVEEKFAAELAAVLANIKDPNTDPEGKRKIVLEFVFQPRDNREKIFASITARSVLGATKPAGDVMYVAKQGDAYVATVLQGADPREPELPLEPTRPTLVAPDEPRRVQGGDA